MPELGGFLANTVHASLDKESNVLLPPSKSLSFNQSLSSNDGLLVNQIAAVKGLDYEIALEKVLVTTKEWKQKLEQGEKLVLENIGSLQLSDEKKIRFTPENKINYLTTSFGLSSISAIPIKREELKKKVEVLEAATPLKITPEQRKESKLRPWLKYAAVVLFLVSASATGYLGFKNFGDNQLLVEEQADKEVIKQLQQATFFDTAPIELPPLELETRKILDGPNYHIIAGAFRSKANADRKVTQLKNEGYDATYIGANSFGLHQVAFATFGNQGEARSQLRQIRQASSSDAWILTKK